MEAQQCMMGGILIFDEPASVMRGCIFNGINTLGDLPECEDG